jgi:hypothetical protein
MHNKTLGSEKGRKRQGDMGERYERGVGDEQSFVHPKKA